MKTLLTIALASIFSFASLFANDIEEKKLQRKIDMHKLSSGLKLVQDGIIYSDKSILLSGIEMIKKGEKTLLSAHGDQLKQYLPKDTAYAYKYAQNAGKRIATYSNELKDLVENDGDYTEVSQTFSLILNECAGCHLRIRQK